MLPPIDELMAMTNDQLDALKQREYRTLVLKSNNKLSLQCMQIAINHMIRTAPNKFAAMLKIKSLMNVSLIILDDALQGVTPK
tara:strand:- start:10123 stop:10371 length:249 start_codon:yes stop_codon:yes gene_type:complete